MTEHAAILGNSRGAWALGSLVAVAVSAGLVWAITPVAAEAVVYLGGREPVINRQQTALLMATLAATLSLLALGIQEAGRR